MGTAKPLLRWSNLCHPPRLSQWYYTVSTGQRVSSAAYEGPEAPAYSHSMLTTHADTLACRVTSAGTWHKRAVSSSLRLQAQIPGQSLEDWLAGRYTKHAANTTILAVLEGLRSRHMLQ